jgi:hypothetical protein
VSYPFGTANAEETAIAHQIADGEEFDNDPVQLYGELLGKHGVEATGRIWSLACKLYDRAHEAS